MITYLTHGFNELVLAMSGIDAYSSKERITSRLVEICQQEIRCTSAEYIPPERVRAVYGDHELARQAITEKNCFLEEGRLNIPLRNNGYRNLGVLCLEGLGIPVDQTERPHDPVIDYLGSHAGQIIALTLQRDTDPLTGLLRRGGFFHIYEQDVQKAHRHQTPLGIIMLDLDHFKWYNDSYGHLQGDVALRTAGTIIRDAVRDEDTPARYGGEEFVVLLPDVSVSEAQAIGERIRADFEKARIEVVERVTLTENQEYHLGTPRKLQCSVGVACFPDHTDDPFELIKRADTALYAAKKTRNTVTVYSSGM